MFRNIHKLFYHSFPTSPRFSDLPMALHITPANFNGPRPSSMSKKTIARTPHHYTITLNFSCCPALESVGQSSHQSVSQSKDCKLCQKGQQAKAQVFKGWSDNALFAKKNAAEIFLEVLISFSAKNTLKFEYSLDQQKKVNDALLYSTKFFPVDYIFLTNQTFTNFSDLALGV